MPRELKALDGNMSPDKKSRRCERLGGPSEALDSRADSASITGDGSVRSCGGHRDDGSPRSRHPVHHLPCLVARRFRRLAPARCSPPPQAVTVDRRADGGQPLTPFSEPAAQRLRRTVPTRWNRPTDGCRSTARARPPDLRRVAPHGHLHAAIGRRQQRVLRQVHVRVRPRAAPGDRGGLRTAGPRPASTRWPASSWAASRWPRSCRR